MEGVFFWKKEKEKRRGLNRIHSNLEYHLANLTKGRSHTPLLSRSL